MKRLLLSAVMMAGCAILGNAPLLAQPTTVPPELARYEPLLGDWVGEGVAMMAPGQPPLKWTSRSRIRRALGGHFLREEMIIELSDPYPMKLGYLSWHAYDTERSRWVTYSISNSGQMMSAEVFWPAQNTLVTMGSGREGGAVMAERWTSILEGDTQKVEGQRLDLVGGLKTTVQGVMRRSEKPVEIDLDRIPYVGMTPDARPAEEMDAVMRMKGLYDVEGHYRMSPDQEPTRFEGVERIRPLFGGAVLLTEARGEGYEGFGAMAWDPEDEVYRRLSLSSQGWHHIFTARLEDPHHLVHRFHGLMMGQPTMVRTILKLDDEGAATKGWSDTLFGTHAPVRSYEGTYRRRDGGEGGR